MSCEKSKHADPYRANRRFERFLGLDINAPREDQNLTSEERLDVVGKKPRPLPNETDELIATITFYPDEQKIVIKREDELSPKE